MLARLDRYFPWAAALAAASTLAALAMIFFYAPVETTMGVVQKIFYSHVPAAFCGYAGFTLCSVASFIYLLRPSARWDIAARSGADVGLLFFAYVLISGPLWGWKAWGVPWKWEDVQLTASFVLFLLYGGYVLLRTLSPPSSRVRKIGAVLAVVAFVDIPLIHYAVQRWALLHPKVERTGGGGLAPEMYQTLLVSQLAFLLLCVTMIWALIRLRRTAHVIDQLHLDLEDASLAREVHNP